MDQLITFAKRATMAVTAVFMLVGVGGGIMLELFQNRWPTQGYSLLIVVVSIFALSTAVAAVLITIDHKRNSPRRLPQVVLLFFALLIEEILLMGLFFFTLTISSLALLVPALSLLFILTWARYMAPRKSSGDDTFQKELRTRKISFYLWCFLACVVPTLITMLAIMLIGFIQGRLATVNGGSNFGGVCGFYLFTVIFASPMISAAMPLAQIQNQLFKKVLHPN